MAQEGFFPALPPGFEYRSDFLSLEDEQQLLREIEHVQFNRVEMRGVVARRRTAHYGHTYVFERRDAVAGAPIPGFLMPARARMASWAGLDPETLAQAVIIEYPEGAPIGWHRDAPMFGDVAGISLGASCRMKFRPYVSPKDLPRGGTRRTTHEIELAARSSYLIRGAARRDYEHSIPPVARKRYSITFRTLRR